MAIPAEVLMRTVTYGPETDFEGNSITGTLTFTPSEPITWVASGQGFHVRPITIALNVSGSGSKDLICTDQAGFRDADGQTITNWHYIVTANLAGVAGTTGLTLAPGTESAGSTYTINCTNWRTADRAHAGTGSPESVLTAPVGSTYSRRDGGASTSFYVKETGTGTTGWIAK